MLSRVLRTITRHQLLAGSTKDPGARRVLCAVSGGPDSMALLASLWELAPRLGLHLEVATVDHGLRPEATEEMELVAARAAALGLPWHALRIDVRAARQRQSFSGTRPGGVQEVARRMRLGALAELAAGRGLSRVALGHNADDQSETVLFRILRGTGIAGLAGIPYWRGPFIRPMLDVTRVEILRYLQRRSLPYATDRSNADRRYARARLRHDILPLLRRENPRLDRALRSLAAVAAAAVGRDHDELARSVTAQAAAAATAATHIPVALLAEIAAVARQGHGTRSYDLPGGRKVTVAYGRVRIEPQRQPGRRRSGSEGSPAAIPMPIPGPGSYPVGPRLTIALREETVADPTSGRDDPQDPGQDSKQWVWFDGDRLSWPLSVRYRRSGDRMRPRGGAGSKKLSDLLIDAKVPRLDRASLPVVTDADGELLYVPGLRPARSAQPSGLTRRWIGLAALSISDHDALVDPPVSGGNTDSDPRPQATSRQGR
jgi:tRNA(Ile)-lysidine synthase